MFRRPDCSVLIPCVLVLAVVGCEERQTANFGAVVPVTGEAAEYGESIQYGIELARDMVVAENQLPFDIELQLYDSTSDPEIAAQLLQELYDNGNIAVIGGVTSDEALAMVGVADTEDRVLLSPSASSPELSGISRNFFRIFPTSREEAVTMANFARDRLQLEEVVVIMENDAYGHGVTDSFREVYEGLDGTITEVLEIPSPTNEVSEEVTQALTHEPRGVYLAADGEELANLIRELRDQGFDQDQNWILATSAMALPSVIRGAGKAAEGVFLSQTVFDPESEEEPMASFVEAYELEHGSKPDFFAAHGYDALMVFVEALEEIQTTIAGEFVKGMRSVQNYAGVTGNIQFRESGDVQKFMRVYYIREGKAVDYEEALRKIREELEARRMRIMRERERLMRQQQQLD